ncbi:hypothetical protein, conserved [Eimeria tenella]|uniref:Uncharacterized protein n=1 Tax=Eimeria tenella TaxID=5802 RepID=U6KW54_EIMTE|nr:hypothetical protein, conserved [Eimeria tenella]CDJ40574.1 hypothetical protein, conserved [Eimeria tenella]|eukprot:XP_013231324.1 hypothetical protein, conserved [Eimeria tenella]
MLGLKTFTPALPSHVGWHARPRRQPLLYSLLLLLTLFATETSITIAAEEAEAIKGLEAVELEQDRTTGRTERGKGWDTSLPVGAHVVQKRQPATEHYGAFSDELPESSQGSPRAFSNNAEMGMNSAPPAETGDLAQAPQDHALERLRKDSLFSGRPSCPSSSPASEERRRRAAAAAGKALLRSHFQQQQRWLLLHQRKNQADQTTRQQQLHISAEGNSKTETTLAGHPSASSASSDSSQFADMHKEGAVRALSASRPGKQILQEREGNTQIAAPASCAAPRYASPFLEKKDSPTCASTSQRASQGILLRHTARDKGDSTKETKEAAQAEHGKVRDPPKRDARTLMRDVWGGFEATTEETAEEESLLKSPGAAVHWHLWGSSAGYSIAEKYIARGGQRGAAVGVGENPEMTWVLGAPTGNGLGLHQTLEEERAALLEALDYSFMVNAEQVQRDGDLVGPSSRHAYAGVPYAVTLQFGFDSVPLHEQRAIEAALETKEGSVLENPIVGHFWTALEEALGQQFVTPAQVQLSGQGANEVSLVEGGPLHLTTVAEEWVQQLDGPEGVVELELLSLTLEDLRVILALEDETGGPLSLVAVEDWGKREEENPHYLLPAQGLQTLTKEGSLEPLSKSSGKEEEEDADDVAEDEAFWEFLKANPSAW